MDNIIFEDPSKRRARPHLPLPVQPQPIQAAPNLHDPTCGAQTGCVPSQRPGPPDFDIRRPGNAGGESLSAILDAFGRLRPELRPRQTEDHTGGVDGGPGGQVHGTPDRSDRDPSGVTAPAVSERVSTWEGDGYEVDEGGACGSSDSLFSSPEPEVPATGVDTGVSTVGWRYEAVPACSFDGGDEGDRGVDSDASLSREVDGRGGGTVNGVALRNKIQGREFGTPSSRSRPSSVDQEGGDDMQRGRECGNGGRGADVPHTTTAREGRRRSQETQVECHANRPSPSDHGDGADATRVVGETQPATLNGSSGHHAPPAAGTTSSPGKRRNVASLKLPSQRRPRGRPRPGPSSRGLVPRTQTGRNLTGPDEAPDEVEDEVEERLDWEYIRLLDYMEVDGRPLVKVSWTPTWEPSSEFSAEEVALVRRAYQWRTRGKRRGRPRSEPKEHV